MRGLHRHSPSSITSAVIFSEATNESNKSLIKYNVLISTGLYTNSTNLNSVLSLYLAEE